MEIKATRFKNIRSPISKLDEVFGLFKAKKVITKSDIKSAYKKAISVKFSKKK